MLERGGTLAEGIKDVLSDGSSDASREGERLRVGCKVGSALGAELPLGWELGSSDGKEVRVGKSLGLADATRFLEGIKLGTLVVGISLRFKLGLELPLGGVLGSSEGR